MRTRLRHTSRHAVNFYEVNNVNWWKTPPERPDLNPIEMVWHELKWYLRKTIKPRAKDELISGIKDFWCTITPEKCLRYIEHVRWKACSIPKVIECEGRIIGNKLGTGKNGTGKNGTGKNGTGRNGTGITNYAGKMAPLENCKKRNEK